MSSAFERLQKIAEEKRKAKLELVGENKEVKEELAQPTQHSIPNPPNIAYPTKTKPPVSPQKDFSKVPNSIAREAIPERWFKGMSKNTYDALYLKTRGAINPVTRIRATRSDLMRWAGVSNVTLDKHLKNLESIGLVKIEFVMGSHEGNWYEVFIPEEIKGIIPNISYPTYHTQHTNHSIPKKVDDDISKKVGYVGYDNTQENQQLTDTSNTLFNTIKNDDEAFAPMIEAFAKINQEFIGRKPSKSDAKNWRELAELLILELKIAASRADSISSVPAFLTEVLRRQFFVLRQQEFSKKPTKTKVDTVGKSNAESDEIKPLDEKGRENALIQLQEFAGEDFLDDFKKWYTPEDWEWLLKQLSKR